MMPDITFERDPGRERVNNITRYLPCHFCDRLTNSRCPRCGRPMCEKHYTVQGSTEISDHKLSYCQVPTRHIGTVAMLALGIEA